MYCHGNMSSPVGWGTHAATAFSSNKLDILNETIHILPDSEFKTARFIVEYTIRCDSGGKQIPLLFYAVDNKDSFSVRVNGKAIEVKPVPTEYIQPGNNELSAFKNPFGIDSAQILDNNVIINWGKHEQRSCRIKDLIFFEATPEKGVNTIRVEYIADVWEDRSDWIVEYSFRYSLSPAKYWRSFGRLLVVVHQQGLRKKLSISTGEYKDDYQLLTDTIVFDKLPGVYLNLKYVPQVNMFARVLCFIGPFGLSVIAALFLAWYNFRGIKKYRLKNTNKRINVSVVTGGLIIPLLVLGTYILAFTAIDVVIGEHASEHHGYYVFAVFLYPALMPVYALLALYYDWRCSKKISSTA